MRSLAALDHNLQQIIDQTWPGLHTTSSFLPLVDLGLGDVGSPVALEVARKLSIAPQEVLSILAQVWPKDFSEQICIHRNFFNLKLPIDLQDARPREICSGKKITGERCIYIPKLYQDQSAGGYLRLAARALLQAELLSYAGLVCKVVRLEDGLEIVGATLLDKLRYFLKHCGHVSDVPIAALVSRVSSGLGNESQHAYLWLLPATIPTQDFQRLFPNNDRRADLTLCYSDMSWAQMPFSLANYLELSDTEESWLASLVVLLSEDSPGSDLDLYVAGSKENANLLWSLELSAARAKSLKAFFIQQESIPANSELRALLIRQCFLGEFMHRAAEFGELGQFLTVLREYAVIFNRLFNSPSFRLSHANNANKEAKGYNILAGVFDSISAMLRHCPVLRT